MASDIKTDGHTVLQTGYSTVLWPLEIENVRVGENRQNWKINIHTIGDLSANEFN